MDFRGAFVWSGADKGLGLAYGHTGSATTDCVRFMYAILLDIYGDRVRKLSDSIHLARSPLGSFDNIEALVSEGLAVTVTSPADDGGVYLAQGWRKNNAGKLRGHMFSIVAPKPPPFVGDFWIMESNVHSDWFRPVDWAKHATAYTEGIRWCRLNEV